MVLDRKRKLWGFCFVRLVIHNSISVVIQPVFSFGPGFSDISLANLRETILRVSVAAKKRPTTVKCS